MIIDDTIDNEDNDIKNTILIVMIRIVFHMYS